MGNKPQPIINIQRNLSQYQQLIKDKLTPKYSFRVESLPIIQDSAKEPYRICIVKLTHHRYLIKMDLLLYNSRNQVIFPQIGQLCQKYEHRFRSYLCNTIYVYLLVFRGKLIQTLPQEVQNVYSSWQNLLQKWIVGRNIFAVQNENTMQDLQQQNQENVKTRINEKILLPTLKPFSLTPIQKKNSLMLQSKTITYHLIKRKQLEKLFQKLRKLYITQDEMSQIKYKYQNYIDMCKQSKKFKAQTDKFVQKIAKQFLQTKIQIELKNLACVKILDMLFSVENINQNLRFNIKDQQQVDKMAKIVFRACHSNLDAFVFFSLYIEQCAKVMKQKQISIQEISKQIEKELNRLMKNQYKANDTVMQQDQLRQAFQLVWEERQFNSINSETVDQIFLTSKNLTNIGRNTLYTILELANLSITSKLRKIEKFILQQADIARSVQKTLIHITEYACYSNNGQGYKTNIKIGSRVKQKLLYQQNFQIYKYSLQDGNLKNYIENEQKFFNQQLCKRIAKINELIFDVKDILRGKCMFKELVDLLRAAKEIKKIAQSNYCRIVEVKNRLGIKTRDFVMIIQIQNEKRQKILAEFQLALQFSYVKNQFNHKLYQIARNKMNPILISLLKFNQSKIEVAQLIIKRVIKLQSENIQIRAQIPNKNKLTYKQILNEIYRFFQTVNKKLNLRENSKLELKTCYQMLNELQYPQCNNFEEKFQSNYRTALYLYHSQNIQNSKKYLEKFSRQEVSTKITFVEKIKYFNLLAQLYKKTGEKKQLIKIYEQMLKLTFEHSGKSQDDFNQAHELNRLGIAYYNIQDHEKARQCFQRALQKAKDSEDQNLDAQVYNNMAAVQWAVRNFDKALQFNRKSYKINCEKFGSQSIQLVQTLHIMGIIYLQLKDSQNSLACYLQSLRIAKKTMGMRSPKVAQLLNNLAKIYSMQQDYQKAIQCTKESLEIQEKVFGRQSQKIISSLKNLGNFYFNIQKYEQSLIYSREALEIIEKIYGKQSQQYKSIQLNMALIYGQLNDNVEGANFFTVRFV